MCRYGKKDKLSKLPPWITRDMGGDMLNMSIIEAALLARRFFREMAAPTLGKTVEMDVSKVLYSAAAAAAVVPEPVPDAAVVPALAPGAGEPLPFESEVAEDVTSASAAAAPAEETPAPPADAPRTAWSVRDLLTPPPLKKFRK